MISKELLNYVSDADLHTTLHGVNHSTDLRSIVTVGYMLERTDISEANHNGFLNQVSQPEHWGTDVMDHEILTGDEIIELPSGEVLLVDNLEDYLIERCGFQFKQAL